MSTYKKYDRIVIEKLKYNERKSILFSLENELTNRLKSFKNWDEYWNETNEIIKDLRDVGHDLWSHNYDGESKHLWGWDYMNMEKAGFLQIQFDFNEIVTVFWREEDTK